MTQPSAPSQPDPPRGAVEPAVFGTTLVAVVALVSFSALSPENARAIFLGTQEFVVRHFGWLLVTAVGIFPLFCVWAAWGRRGRLRLGDDNERPAYGRLSWFAMLFTAGMGIGIMFYGVAEPILHYATPPLGGLPDQETARRALRVTFFHWGLHAWGAYAVMGLAIAFFSYRRGLPLSIRSPLQPILGDRIHGPIGHLVDILAAFGTLFGLATSLGLGAMQINAGLGTVAGAQESTLIQVGLIGLITAAATVSVVLGVDKGIRRLAEINIALALALLGFVFLAGPTLDLLKEFGIAVADYLVQLTPMTFGGGGLGDDSWKESWTIFYWAWWIAWAPFVGTFIARISRGRTVREFVLGVLLVPTAASLFWFTVFGWSAISLEMTSGGIAAAVDGDLSVGLYALLQRLPVPAASSILAILVVTIFFITSSDSGSFVIDMLTSGGHPNPPVRQRVFWALSEGAVAATLLLTGGLAALKAAAINTGLPFALVLLLLCVGLGIALQEESSPGDSP